MRVRGTAVIVICGLLGFGPAAGARDVEVSGEAGISLASSYVWRGLEVNDKAVVQPEVTLFIDQFALNVWGIWDIEGTPDTSSRTRVDASLDYGFVWKMLQLKGGVVAHVYHDDPGGKASDTYEVFADVAADVPFCPSVVIYYDFGTIEGIYAALGLAESRVINEWASVNIEMRLGMGNEEFNEAFFILPGTPPDDDGAGAAVSTKKAALVDFAAAVSVPMTMGEVNITPKVEYVSLVDQDIRAAAVAADRHPDRLIGSVTVSFAF